MAETERDRVVENLRSVNNAAQRLGQLVADRNAEKLGEEVIWLAQVMLLCTLPYSRTTDRQITRQARLPDQSPLRVTFTAGKPGVDLPYGADRRLLAWLLDRAIRSESPFVLWEAAWQYQREVGLAHSGRSNLRLQASFERIQGLAVSIERKGSKLDKVDSFFVIRQSYLPSSIDKNGAAKVVDIDNPFPGYGVLIDPLFHQDMRRKGSKTVAPRSLWLQIKGNSQVQDMVLFLYWRCYAAESESVIPWSFIEDQFGASSNPRRQRGYARDAVRFLCHLWPGCGAEVVESGIQVTKRKADLLPFDPTKSRYGLLKTT